MLVDYKDKKNTKNIMDRWIMLATVGLKENQNEIYFKNSKKLWTVKKQSTYSFSNHKIKRTKVFYFGKKCSLHSCQGHRQFINKLHKNPYGYFIQDQVEVYYEYQMVKNVSPYQV